MDNWSNSLDLAQKHLLIGEDLDKKSDALGYRETIKIAWRAFTSVAAVRNINNSQEAREMAKVQAESFFELLESLGINVNFHGFDRYSKDILCFLGNHQTFGLEAMGAYGLVPTNTRILLKSSLLKPPFFGGGVEALDPIVYHRADPKSALRNIQAETVNTIENEQPVLIFPEGTRSEDGGLETFKISLYRKAIETIQEMESVRKSIGIITVDTFSALPLKVEPGLLLDKKSRARKTNINFQLNVLDIGDLNSQEINTEVREIIEKNLHRFLNEKR